MKEVCEVLCVDSFLDLPQVELQNFFLDVFKFSLNVFKITSAEGTRNKSKPSAEGAREP